MRSNSRQSQIFKSNSFTPTKNIRNSPRKTPQIYHNHSPSKNKLQVSHPQQLTIKLHQNHIKMNQILETFRAITANKLPPRCNQHNSNISLYCFNEHRLVCVNCVYNQKNHKGHKIGGYESAFGEIKKDNQNSRDKIQLNLIKMKEDQKYLQQYVGKSQPIKTKILSKLESEFDDVMKFLSNKYLQLKMFVFEKCKDSIEDYVALSQQLKQFRQQIQNRIQNLDKKQNNFEQQVSKHLILTKVVQFSNQKQKLIRPKSNIDIIQQHTNFQIKKLKQYVSKFKWSRF